MGTRPRTSSCLRTGRHAEVEAAAKTALYLGVVLLAGGGVFTRWIASPPNDTIARRTAVGMYLGGGLVVAASLVDVGLVVYGLKGQFDLDFFVSYLGTTRHGLATLIRIGLVLVLLLLGVGRAGVSGTAVNRASFAAAALGLLGTISWMSHAAAVGWGPLLADLVHLTSAVAWGGALLYFALLSPHAHRNDVVRAVQRLSTVGGAAVTLLIVTGIYLAFVLVGTIPALTGTAYGWTLLYKVALAATVWAVAAVSRYRLLPAIVQGGSSAPLIRNVRIEAALLLGVLTLTGALTTQAPP